MLGYNVCLLLFKEEEPVQLRGRVSDVTNGSPLEIASLFKEKRKNRRFLSDRPNIDPKGDGVLVTKSSNFEMASSSVLQKLSSSSYKTIFCFVCLAVSINETLSLGL